ncbi:MAG: gamma-glutamylcyclotransferase [Boseongicola sp.]|nr:gamma-glutamylcyclotransferase [Boseongicola sp.]MYH58244.1 gamma-glutamylcyclotransferase [Boseongicola sp. SB0675_bin_26]
MTSAYVFGYGSLVNRHTHGYRDVRKARIAGWRRAWRHLQGRAAALLTVVEDRHSQLDGLIAAVPDAEWAALDLRERNYQKAKADNVEHTLPRKPEVHIYHAPDWMHRPAQSMTPIALSYLDVVVQGYLAEFGETGVARFFATTDGWDAPVLNDRHAPIYRRHRPLNARERGVVDDHLSAFGARIEMRRT